MRRASWMRLVVLTAVAVAWAGCGGGGGGFSVPSTSLGIAATTVLKDPSAAGPAALFASADEVDWAIPLTGGCGGPYVLQVIQGALPAGVSTAAGTDPVTQEPLHHLRGTLLEDGTFSFRLQVTDKGCNPFMVATADLTWDVRRGAVSIVGASPLLYAPGTYLREGEVLNPVYPAIPSAVYGEFGATEFLVAGGTPPYHLQLIDDPTNLDDGPLPVGTTIPPASRSIMGAPVQLKPGGGPFVMSLQAVDAAGATSLPMAVQWEVFTPPIIIATASLPDGKCGSPFSETVQVVDGVPPFEFELVGCDVDRDAEGEPAVEYPPGQPIVYAPACAGQRVSAASYPAPDDLGPDYRSTMLPPEGLFLGDTAGNPLAGLGSFTGTPRRRGDFRVVVHVASTLVPDAFGQQNWRQYEFHVDASEPPVGTTPAFGMNPSFTMTGSFNATQPYSAIADAEVGTSYNPDAATHPAAGLQMLARGGVRKDGLTDAPHASEVVVVEGLAPGQEDGSTPGGGYDWTLDPNPAGDGDAYGVLPPGMAFDGWLGLWRVANASALIRQGKQALELTVQDQQLPTQARNSAVQRVNFSIGPDKVLITESATSGSLTYGSGVAMNDGDQTVRVCMPYTTSAPTVRDLDPTDLCPTHGVPGTTGLSGSSALATLLKGQDFLRVHVNPVVWWDDIHELNARGARPGQHADRNAYDYYAYADGYCGTSTDYGSHPTVTCVDLPPCTAPSSAVTQDILNGVYTSGGRLHVFQNNSYFGVFIIRPDASIYVPCAWARGTYQGFGDGVWEGWSTASRSWSRIPHMAVSPDGRLAALKLKTSETNMGEAANSTPVVVFSLTGEKAFGGQTWTVVSSGSSGGTATGTYLYAPTLTLTNSHLYYVCGNLYGTYTEAPHRSHYLYRFQVTNPTTGAVVAGASGTGSYLPAAVADGSWTNTTNAPMQVRFHSYHNDLSSYLYAYTMGDGGNLLENSKAPMPFRVSADGRSIAILAYPDQASSTTYSQAWHVWVDHQGAGARRLSSAPLRVTGGGTRGYSLATGAYSNQYQNWHHYHGPTPQMEISDDGTKVAVVANRYSGAISYSSPTSYFPTAREDVIAFRTSDFLSWTQLPVTGDGAGTNIFSAASGGIWRFGCLMFTKDNKGLVFWGGCSSYYGNSTSYSYQYSSEYTGTMYGADVSTATSISGLTVTSLLSTNDGGSSAGVASYSTSSPYNPSLPAGSYAGTAGVIKPFGGFISGNREFMYVMNKGGLNSGESTEHRLIGINIRSTNTGLNINGKTDFRGFAVGNWPSRRGFIAQPYAYYPYYGMYISYYQPARRTGLGMQHMSEQKGWVYFATQYQSSGPANYLSTPYGGPINPVYYYDYGGYGGNVHGFNAETGGDVQAITSISGDTSLRHMHYLDPVDEGNALAFVYDTYTTSYASPAYEQLYVATNIGFTTGGSLTATPTLLTIEGSNGRVGDAVAFSSDRTKLYYAYVSGTTDENQKTLKEATFLGGTVTYRTLAGTPRRYTVLYVGR